MVVTPVASWDISALDECILVLKPYFFPSVVGEGVRMHIFLQDPARLGTEGKLHVLDQSSYDL